MGDENSTSRGKKETPRRSRTEDKIRRLSGRRIRNSYLCSESKTEALKRRPTERYVVQSKRRISTENIVNKGGSK